MNHNELIWESFRYKIGRNLAEILYSRSFFAKIIFIEDPTQFIINFHISSYDSLKDTL